MITADNVKIYVHMPVYDVAEPQTQLRIADYYFGNDDKQDWVPYEMCVNGNWMKIAQRHKLVAGNPTRSSL